MIHLYLYWPSGFESRRGLPLGHVYLQKLYWGDFMSTLYSLRSFVKTEGSDAEPVVREHLELLVQLSEAKADYFKIKTASDLRASGTTDNAQVPIESILETDSRVFAVTRIEGDTIKNTVEPLMEKISPGVGSGGKKAINAMVTNIVSGFLGNSAAFGNTEEYYIVYAEHNALIRLDIHLWNQKVNFSGGVKKELNDLLVMTYSKSAIDVQKLKLNTFIALYQRQLSSINLKIDIDEISRIKSIYNLLHDA
ncbi:hypothetical protein [Pseudomonas cichorii]|uniref:hypothetical protein n=1 Tax=Pseudomonas cichorii TaxID=36746 RepID=UPI0019102354|nr:hypothetical protein [Pseudomonas cichorii]